LIQVKAAPEPNRKMPRMPYPTIPIRALPILAAAERVPSLQGEPTRVAAVIAAMAAVVEAEFGPGVPAGVWLRSLRLSEGEVEVALEPWLRQCGRVVAQGAFDALRRLLPDTDIYVGAAPA